ncbi:Odorant receptor 103, partial [Halyomorpha halys]
EICRLGIVLSILVNSVMLTLFYALYEPKLKKFYKDSNTLSYNIMNSELEHYDLFKKNYLKVAKSNNNFTRNVLFFVLCTPLIYCVPTPIIDLCNREYRKHLPFIVRYPYDEHRPGIYEITFFLQMLAILYGDVKKFANDCFFLTVFRIHTVYLKYLSASIRTLGQDFEEIGDAVIKRKLVTWLKLHNHLI